MNCAGKQREQATGADGDRNTRQLVTAAEMSSDVFARVANVTSFVHGVSNVADKAGLARNA